MKIPLEGQLFKKVLGAEWRKRHPDGAGVMKHVALTVYYDGKCALCCEGMARLCQWDKAGRLSFVDIAAPGFSAGLVGVSLRDLNAELHARTADGRLLTGIDSILAAYTLVGQGWRVAPLHIKPLRPVLSALYRSLARNRYYLAAWLGKKAPVCGDGACERKILDL